MLNEYKSQLTDLSIQYGSAKIEQLWVGEDLATLAYYKLRGIQVINGILNVNTIKIGPKYVAVSGTASTLMLLREEYPEITKEEVIGWITEKS